MSTKITNQIISVEGNIGSGKSTLLQNLANSIDAILVKEPVDVWSTIKDESGETMLEKFYKNPEKYAFPFQMMAYISRLHLLKETCEQNPNKIIITERSLYTDKLVFAKMLYNQGKIEDVNYQIYLRWFDTFAKEFPISKLIYVDASPETCHIRISKRSRQGEEGIPIEYLRDCHKYHEDMMKEMNITNILNLDGNIDINEHTEQLEIWIKEIRAFIQ